MIRFGKLTIGLALSVTLCVVASGLEQFPPPDFVETNHVMPSPTTPHPRLDVYEYVDAALLLAALSLSSYLVLRKRSRRAVFVLMLLSLFYFGFWREGCVCPIGSTQNIVLSIFDTDYAVPLVVLAFFLLPLLFTLFFGRTFCAAVCPLGAIQDVVLLRPAKVPRWVESVLRLFAYIYLGAAVLFAATGSAFLICRYDPFVSFFRLTGGLNILVLGACFLLIGVFVGRPYCRFACPYGVILRQFSRISKWRVTITPDECVHCKLCEDACPFGAIREPVAEWPADDYRKAKKRLAYLIVFVPVMMLAGGWMTSGIKHVTARMHERVRLAERIYTEETGQVTDSTDASAAYRATGAPIEELYDEAEAIRAQFGTGGWIFGAFVGLVIGIKLIGLSVWRQRTDYEASRASCLACGRCYKYCPREHVRLEKLKEPTGRL
ncbi:MAG: 4Fe-4S binding protein [Planctomycetota bacterium]|jgi:ferredoxin